MGSGRCVEAGDRRGRRAIKGERKDRSTIRMGPSDQPANLIQIIDELRLTGDYWCARSSLHTLASSASSNPTSNGGLYDMFKQGLLIKHSEASHPPSTFDLLPSASCPLPNLASPKVKEGLTRSTNKTT